LIGPTEQRGGNDHVSRSDITGDGDVPDRRQTQQRLDVRVVRLRFERVPEEHEDVDQILRDLRADLLVPTHRPAEETGNGQPELIFKEGSRRTGGVESVFSQGLPVVLGPAQQLYLLVVVCDQSDVSVRLGDGNVPSIPKYLGVSDIA
jgi:hypothetical protein